MNSDKQPAVPLTERIESKIMGLEIALECEEAVVAYLLPFREQFQSRKADDMRLTRRNRQLLDSESNVRAWTQEIADLRALLTNQPAPAGDAAPVSQPIREDH